MPAVAVRSRPKGLPIAITESPTRTRVGVAELERRQPTRARLDAEDGEVGRGIAADELRRQRVLVREADLDRVGALDHVVVRDDVAGLVDDEAGAERLLRARGRERGAGRFGVAARGRRGDLDDARRGAVVDVAIERRPPAAAGAAAAGAGEVSTTVVVPSPRPPVSATPPSATRPPRSPTAARAARRSSGPRAFMGIVVAPRS